MEGGNEATSGSGITQFANGEPKRLNCAYQNDAAGNLLGSRAKLAEEVSREVRKLMKSGNGATIGSVVTLRRAWVYDQKSHERGMPLCLAQNR